MYYQNSKESKATEQTTKCNIVGCYLSRQVVAERIYTYLIKIPIYDTKNIKNIDA